MSGRRAVMAGLAALALCVGMVAGCGDGQSSRENNKQRPASAEDIDDRAPKYLENQIKCPVCEIPKLREEIYVDVDGKRIYFDKKECRKKFEENRSKYLQKLDKWKKGTSGGEK